MEERHIAVCICTFKRPVFLKRLLEKLQHQKTKGLFSYSMVVADNDVNQSAKSVVTAIAAYSSIPVIYCVEPEQNIALARNKAIENAKGDFVAFIDDDEFPVEDWLFNLITTCNDYGSDGVLGPVKPSFDHQPPDWIAKGNFFVRPSHETGYTLSSGETRSGNVLFKAEILEGNINPFRAEFGTGSEDVDFFRRMIGKGRVFVWCENAVVYETVPPERCNKSYLIRLALLRGANSVKHREALVKNLLKSVIAVPAYGLALPFLYIRGEHYFMKYLIKFCDHAGRILAFGGVSLVRRRDF